MSEINDLGKMVERWHDCDYCGGWKELVAKNKYYGDGADIGLQVGEERICGICVKCLKKVFDTVLGNPEAK